MNENRVRPVTVLALCATEFATLAAMVVPAIIGLQLLVPRIDSGLEVEARLSWITTTGAIAALVAGPLFGWLSDYSARGRGHRGGWILGGNVAGLFFVWQAANATTLPEMVFSWVAVQASYGAAFAGLFGTLSDFVPAADRARVVGLFAGSGVSSVAFGGGLVYLMLAGHLGVALTEPRAVFVAMAVVAVPVAALGFLHLRALARVQGRVVPEAAEPVAKPSVLETISGAPSPFWWLLAQRVLVEGAYTSITVYAVLFLVRRTGEDPHEAGQLVAAATAVGGTVAVVTATGVGRFIARRIGYRAAMGLAITCVLAATALMSVSTSTTLFVATHVLAGTGLGLYLSLDLVVGLAMLRTSASAGRLLGWFQAARKVPRSLVPAVGPALLAIGSGDVTGLDRSQNYFALLATGSVLCLVGLLLLAVITFPANTGEPVVRVRR